MVQVIENATLLEGRILKVKPHQSQPDWKTLTLKISKLEPTTDLPNLLNMDIGSELEIALPPGVLPEDQLTGAHFKGVASLAGPGMVRISRDNCSIEPTA